MAETLTIEIKDGGTSTAGVGSRPLPQPVGPAAFAPPPPSPSTQFLNQFYGQPKPAPPASSSEKEFDPVAEARKQLEREKRAAAVKAEYLKLNPPAPLAPPAFWQPALKAMAPVLPGGMQQLAGLGMNLHGAMTAAAPAGAAATAAPAAVAGLSMELMRNTLGLGLAGYALKKSYEATNRLAERLAPFSPALAISQAQADMRQIMGDLRRAQYIGTDLARFNDAKSNLSQSGQDLLVATLKLVVPPLTAIMQILTPIVEVLTAVVEGINWLLRLPAEIISSIPGIAQLGEFLGGILEYIKKIWEWLVGKEDNAMADAEKLWEMVGLPKDMDAPADIGFGAFGMGGLRGAFIPGGGSIMGGV